MSEDEAPGVDVSRWNEEVDWSLLASNGILWAGMRASVGSYYTDRTFEFNYDQALAVGILPIPYHVVNPNNSVAEQLTRYRLSLDGRKPVGTIVDAELVGNVSNTVLRRRYVWFIRDGLNDPDFGSQWILYSNKSFAETHLKAGYMGFKWVDSIPLFVASYGANDGTIPPTPPYPRMPYQWKKWHVWQYTSKGDPVGDLDLMDATFYRNLRARSGIPEPGGIVVPPPSPTNDPTVLDSGLYEVL